MIATFSDTLCVDYKVFLEPILAYACSHLGAKKGMSRSKYIRKIVIEDVKKSDFPLDKLSNKFKEIHRGMSTFK